MLKKSRDHDYNERIVVPFDNNAGAYKVHLVYPNTYRIAMSSLGYQVVYEIFSKITDVAVERFFLPDDFSISQTIKQLKTFERDTPLIDCDILAFSVQFEHDYLNIIWILKQLGLLSADAKARQKLRNENSYRFPLIIVGGAAVTINPEAIADFVDAVLLGEGEESLADLFNQYKKSLDKDSDMDGILRDLSKIEGIYVPEFFEPKYNLDQTISRFENHNDLPKPKRRYVADLCSYPAYSKIIAPKAEFKSMFLIETSRGCEMSCKFCAASHVFRPVRRQNKDAIMDMIDIGLQHSTSLGFIGASVSSHPDIVEVVEIVNKKGGRASLSSLMAHKISPDLVSGLIDGGALSIALAPEVGNESLRKRIGKNISDDQIIDAANVLVNTTIQKIKLYYMIGLPFEEERDVEDIVRLTMRIKECLANAKGKKKSLVLSVNAFIPKAWTPYQWYPLQDEKILKRKFKFITEGLKKIDGIEIKMEGVKQSFLQAFISRADRRAGKILHLMMEQGYDEKWLFQNKNKIIFNDVPKAEFYCSRVIGFDETLPWEVFDGLIDKEYLIKRAKE